MVDVKITPLTWDIAQIDSGSFKADARKAVVEHMDKVQQDVAKYPPPVPTYVRTNVLFRSWHKTVLQDFDQVMVTIYNDAMDKYGRLYSKFVHGDSQGLSQRAYHAQRGWLNLYQTHVARQGQLTDATQGSITRWLKRIFHI